MRKILAFLNYSMYICKRIIEYDRKRNKQDS